MQIGTVGLGRMGANMVCRLMHKQHEVVVYDLKQDSIATLAEQGAPGCRNSNVDQISRKLRV